MLTIRGVRSGGLGSLVRRDFLKIGALGPLGLAWPSFIRAESVATSGENPTFGRAKRCIFIFLNGGPSQVDLWDMKPDAPSEIRGELQPIATRTPGLSISELLPKTARQTDKFKLVRSVTHEASVHTTAVYTMLTGTHHPTPQIDQTQINANDHPHLGSVYAKFAGWTESLPPFISLPMLFTGAPVDGVWPGQKAGFLGRKFDPFVIEGEKASARFRLPALDLPTDLGSSRLEDRRWLRERLDNAFSRNHSDGSLADFEGDRQQAYSLLKSRRLQQAIELDRETDRVRDRYGRHLFGQGLLLARRLVENGIPLVTIYWIDPTPPGPGGGEYDSHGRIYWHMRNRLLPPTDQGLSALFEDLFDRGLLSDTLVVVMSEFGRSPKLNADAGRDHWPQVQSILLAGAGIAGGTVFGASDKHGAIPSADPVSPPDLGQTILHLLGVPDGFELHDLQGRPVAASPGRIVRGLLS